MRAKPYMRSSEPALGSSWFEYGSRRDLAVLQGKYRFYQTSNPRRRFQMADIGLD